VSRHQGGSAREAVLRTLRRRIVRSELPPGSPIAEKEVSAELGISRTPVREALMLLREEGLVQVFPQLGTFVTRISLERVRQSQFIREALECASLGEALGRAGAQDHREVAAVLDEQRAAIRALDYDAFFELDDAFHRRLMKVAGRDDVWPEVSSAKTHLDRARRLSLPLPNVLSRLYEEHAAIAHGLAVGDATLSIGSLRTHLRAVFADVDEIRSARPEFFTEGAGDRPTRSVTTALL